MIVNIILHYMTICFQAIVTEIIKKKILYHLINASFHLSLVYTRLYSYNVENCEGNNFALSHWIYNFKKYWALGYLMVNVKQEVDAFTQVPAEKLLCNDDRFEWLKVTKTIAKYDYIS